MVPIVAFERVEQRRAARACIASRYKDFSITSHGLEMPVPPLGRASGPLPCARLKVYTRIGIST